MSLIEVVTGPGALAEAHALRVEVFVREQGVPLAEEVDDADFAPTTTHVVARPAPGGPVIGTARLLTDPAHPGHVHVGRVAVAAAARGRGVGAELMAALETIALARYAVPAADVASGAARGVPAADLASGADVASGAASQDPGEPSGAGAQAVRVELSAQVRAIPFYERLGYEIFGPVYLDAGIEHRDATKTLTRAANRVP